jgi:Tol biopolymer transport system component
MDGFSSTSIKPITPEIFSLTHTRGTKEDDLDWSNSNRLVFSRGRFRARTYELFTIRPNGLGLRRLTYNDVREFQPDWAPGGRRLAFVRGGPFGTHAEVWRMRASGVNASEVAFGYGPTWAPDGSHMRSWAKQTAPSIP